MLRSPHAIAIFATLCFTAALTACGGDDVPTATDSAPVTTVAPETVAPETAAPETTAPETVAPETVVPETVAPVTTVEEPVDPIDAALEGVEWIDGDLLSILEAVDLDTLHDIDIALNDGIMEVDLQLPFVLRALGVTQRAQWPIDVDPSALEAALVDLVNALEAGDLPAAAAAGLTVHNVGHDLEPAGHSH